MTMDDRDDMALNALFQAAKKDEPDPAFLERLQFDGMDSISHQAKTMPQFKAGPRWLDRLLPASGLAIATLAGVWIGVAVPEDGFAPTATELDIAAFLPGPTLNGFAEWDDNQ